MFQKNKVPNLSPSKNLKLKFLLQLGPLFLLELVILRGAPVEDYNFFLELAIIRGAPVGDCIYFWNLWFWGGSSWGFYFFLELVILRGAPVRNDTLYMSFWRFIDTHTVTDVTTACIFITFIIITRTLIGTTVYNATRVKLNSQLKYI